jgi:hypothetical protein
VNRTIPSQLPGTAVRDGAIMMKVADGISELAHRADTTFRAAVSARRSDMDGEQSRCWVGP